MSTWGREDRRSETSRGYSLPELLIVIALIGLFVLFGGPSVSEAFRSYKVRSVANVLATDIKALRYNAVANRTLRTMTLNNQNHLTAPNQYSYTNAKGNPITVRVEDGVNIESASAATISFNIYGSTGVAGTQVVLVSMWINDSRSDRYTISVSPTGTVSTAYSTF
jgi:prepilin-type N-terminal cleavage/methylation domain-containing protein